MVQLSHNKVFILEVDLTATRVFPRLETKSQGADDRPLHAQDAHHHAQPLSNLCQREGPRFVPWAATEHGDALVLREEHKSNHVATRTDFAQGTELQAAETLYSLGIILVL